jgi:hypothetical protein
MAFYGFRDDLPICCGSRYLRFILPSVQKASEVSWHFGFVFEYWIYVSSNVVNARISLLLRE